MSLLDDVNHRLPILLSDLINNSRMVLSRAERAADIATNATNSSTSGHGAHHGVHAPEVLSAVFVIFIASITKYVHVFWGRKLGIPYSVLVILIGIAMAYGTFALTDSHAFIGNSFTSAISIKGDVAFLLFLPLLLFLPAYHIPLHSFRILWKQIFITALFGRGKYRTKITPHYRYYFLLMRISVLVSRILI